NLKKLLKGADELYLATDEDREGESIAWHLSEVLSPTVPVKRMVFHEITRAAIERAVDEWRDLDRRLVDAQEARRILDRLYGYEVSPVLWKKIMPRLSAGRVQSVATRMVVERERARMKFRSASWWCLEGTFATEASSESPPASLEASLASVDGTPLASGRDFSEMGELTSPGSVVVLNEADARSLAAGLEDQPFAVTSVTEKPFRRSPAAPFMTSTLQQDAGRKLRFSSQRTMQIAQRLYEGGWITYMRPDSTTLSAQGLTRPRSRARLAGTATDGRVAEFSASGTVIRFPGFLRAYVEGEDDPEAELADREVHLPPVSEGDPLSAESIEAGSHATQPPARYTEASLVKAMEDLGVCRPSTYATWL